MMGTSKTGWTDMGDRWDKFLSQESLRRDGTHRRVCISVHECPETMTRAELREKMKAGWQRRHSDGAERFIAYPEVLEIQQDWWWNDITHARPHDQAPWTKIVD